MQDRYRPNQNKDNQPDKDDCKCKEKDTATQKAINAERAVYCDELSAYAGDVYQWEENYFGLKALKKKKNSKYVLPQQLISENVWLLEEGHCFRNQVMNFCELRDKSHSQFPLSYEAGSIETLIHLVDMYEGLTIIPQLALNHLKKQQLSKVTEFAKPQPSRQINLIALKNYPRVKLLKAIQSQIINALPKSNDKQLKTIPIA